MKKLILFLLLISCFISFGQADDDAYSEALENFKSHFNEHQFDSIHGMFAESMKKAITLEVLKAQMDKVVAGMEAMRQ